MNSLTSAERRALRAKAHALRPVVSIGQHGLTPAVLHEIDVALLAHALIKIRVFGDDRVAREAVYARICSELDAAPVQHIGKLLVVWRPAPEAEPEPAARRPAPRRGKGAPKPAPRPARRKAGPKVGAAVAVVRRGVPGTGAKASAYRSPRGLPRAAGAAAPGRPRRRRVP